MSLNNVRVRFAPSPTGPLHIGGIRTALYNYLFAKKHNGTFILRIEDTDQNRLVAGAQQYIEDSLTWCGILPTEGPNQGGDYGPYVQSERKHLYKQYAEELIANGKAYYAFDTTEEIEAAKEKAKENNNNNWQYDAVSRKEMVNSLTLSAEALAQHFTNETPYVIRIAFPENHNIQFNDIIRGEVSVNTSNLDDKVLFKSDGMPTYHLANIVDDHLMEISHVIRGEEWLPSAPLHVFLYESFGWKAPEFAHLPLLLKPDGNGKLSKRDGDRLGFPVFPLKWTSPEGEISNGYRESGYERDGFMNMLAFLGWNPGTEQELFSMAELAEAFSLEHVHKAGAKFDLAKTKWFQEQYLHKRNNNSIAEELNVILNNSHSIDYLTKVAEMMKVRTTFAKDIPSEAPYLFSKPITFNQETINKKWKENTSLILTKYKVVLQENNEQDPTKLEEQFKSFVAQQEIGLGAIMPNLRLVLSGETNGPGIFEMISLFGLTETLARIDEGIEYVKQHQA